MGVYDMFGEHHEQLKVGECILHHFFVGETVGLPNGIYCGYERAIVINGGLFVADMPLTEIFDKWGVRIELDIDCRNPLRQVLKDMEEKEDENTLKRDDESPSKST